MRRKRIIQNLFWSSFILIIGVCIYISFSTFGIKEKYIEVEAGTEIQYVLNDNNIRDYVYINPLLVHQLTVDATHVNFYKCGEYTVTVTNRRNKKNVKLIVKIVDNQTPYVVWKENYEPELILGDTIVAESFVEKAEDYAGIASIYFLTPKDGRELYFTAEQAGTYTMPVVVQDLNANKVTKEVTFQINEKE